MIPSPSDGGTLPAICQGREISIFTPASGLPASSTSVPATASPGSRRTSMEPSPSAGNSTSVRTARQPDASTCRGNRPGVGFSIT